MAARFTTFGIGVANVGLVAAGVLLAVTDENAPAPAAVSAPAWPPFDGELDCRGGLLQVASDFTLSSWTYAARTAEHALDRYLGGLRGGNSLLDLTYERYDGGPNRAVFVGFRPDGSKAAAIPFVTGGERWPRDGLSQC